MRIPFVKYEGTGNDFILFDDRARVFPGDAGLIRRLCDRHFGIGADGVILLRDSQVYDFEMDFYNPDGSKATFCGNGGRCIVAFAQSLEIVGNNVQFLAPDGSHYAEVLDENGRFTLVSLKLNDPVIYEANDQGYYLNTGTYHYVTFVSDIDKVDVIATGRKIRHQERFAPHGTNVNFVEKKSESIIVRTYEKGVENETLSCGTGVTASAIAASLRDSGSRFRVMTPGGELIVKFDNKEGKVTNVWLEGPVNKVFEGQFSF